MRLGCIVMASGEGRRFRAAGGCGPKLLEMVDGPSGRRPLVVHAAASVPADLYEVAVVARPPEVPAAIEASGLPVAVIELRGEVPPPRSETTRAGAVHAMRRNWDGVLYLPGDQPLVSFESLRRLAAAFEADPRRAYRLGWRGSPGSPVLFPAGCLAELARLQGDDGGSSLIRAGAVDCGIVEAGCPEELLDADVPEDITRIERAFSARRHV